MQKHINCIEKLDQDLDVITKKQRMEMISCLRLTLDFIHAVSTFPKGILWGERFSSMTVGLIGTTSSFIGLYQYFAKKRLAKN
jgi:peroxin-11C